MKHRRGQQSKHKTVRVNGCASCRLMLTCPHLSAVIAILEVDYKTQEEQNANFTGSMVEDLPIRESVNKRCSGVNHCSYILTQDCPDGDKWPEGNLSIKYACVEENKIKKYCNSDIVLPGLENSSDTSQGFIHNPGYPRFYSGVLKCHWKITAPEQQKVEITILDLSVIVDNVVNEDDCTDLLEIRDADSGVLLHSTCRQEYPPHKILSANEVVEVVLTATQEFNPRRGVLMHYTAVGCPTPQPPEDGYLAFRNDTIAEFRCCVGFHFPDTGKRVKILNCLGSYWDVSLPLMDCTRNTYRAKPLEKVEKPSKMTSELVAPAVVILLLFVVNAGILFFIYKEKKKQNDVIKDEELKNLSPSRNYVGP